MEIARSQLSQGPRGCSAGEEEQGPEKFSPETLSHCCRMIEGEVLRTQPGTALRPAAAKVWQDAPDRLLRRIPRPNAVASSTLFALKRKRETPKWGRIKEMPLQPPQNARAAPAGMLIEHPSAGR